MSDLTEFTRQIKLNIEKANKIYSLDIDPEKVEIIYYKNGRSAGWAYAKTDHNGHKKYFLKFNLFNIENNYQKMTEEVIPHEVAHIVCLANPDLGYAHDKGWKKVCLKLGGTASRTHDMEVQKARMTKKYVYHVEGLELTVGAIRHNKIQLLKAKYTVNTRGKKVVILPSHYYGATLNGFNYVEMA